MVNEGLQIVFIKSGYIRSGVLKFVRIEGAKAFQSIAIGGDGLLGLSLLVKIVFKGGHDILPGVFWAGFSHGSAVTS